MAGRVAVAVLLSLGLGVALGHASTSDCSISEGNVKEGEVQTIYKSKNNRKKRKSAAMYVLPGRDFQGVRLEVIQVDNSKHTVWFPLDQCYADDTKWVKLNVTVFTEVIQGSLNKLHFGVNGGSCRMMCTTSSTNLNNMKLSVVAHGSSIWHCDKPPDECLAEQSNQPPLTSHPSDCTTPPGFKTTSIPDSSLEPPPATTTPTATPPSCPAQQGKIATSTGLLTPAPTLVMIITVVAAVVVVVVIVVVVVVCRMRQRRTAASQARHPRQSDPATPSRDSVHVRENSLYESFSGPPSPAATREHQQQVYVRENDLYESFSGPMNPAATREHQQQMYIRENSLYETFSGPPTPAAT